MKPEEKKILYKDAAIQRTAKVFDDNGSVLKEFEIWQGVKDNKFSTDEHRIRINNCTHHECNCGKEIENNGWQACQDCRHEQRMKKYREMQQVPWGSFPVVIFDGDQYFFDEEEFLEYCENEDISPEDLNLCVAEPNHMGEIDTDYWSCIIPEENDDPFSKEFHEGLKALNELIKNHAPISYSQGHKRTKYVSE